MDFTYFSVFFCLSLCIFLCICFTIIGKTCERLSFRQFIRELRQPFQFPFGIHIHISSGKYNIPERLLVLIRTIINNLRILKSKIFCQSIFVPGHDFRIDSLLLIKIHQPGKGVRLKGIANPVIGPILF